MNCKDFICHPHYCASMIPVPELGNTLLYVYIHV